MLLGREPETARIDAAIAAARAGGNATLVLVGDPGMGKSALLAESRDRAEAAGLRVLTARGNESEAGLPFAGLSQLIGGAGAGLDEIPETQREALAIALALSPGPAPDRFAVAAGLLSVVSVVAERAGGLLITVDDAQWLDGPSREAIMFTARRLGQDGVAIVVASRPDPPADLEGDALQRIDLGGISAGAAAELLRSSTSGEVGDEPLLRLTEASGGNPLALIETPRTLSGEQLSGRAPLPTPIRPAAAIERSFEGRVASLPEETQRVLLVVAAAEEVDRASLEQALGALGLDASALADAERAGIIEIETGRIHFSHPVLRSVVYHRGVDEERRAAHLALADAAPAGDAGRRAWHHAAAASGFDEDVAAELLAAAEKARERGAPASAGELIARACELTADPDERVRRTLAAVDAFARSGNLLRARSLADAIVGTSSDPDLAADVKRSGAILRMRFGELTLAHQQFIEVADELAERRPQIAARALIEASFRDRMVGDYDELDELAERARMLAMAADPPDDAATGVAELQRAIVSVLTGRGEDAFETMLRREDLILSGDPTIAPEVIIAPVHSSIWIEEFDWAWRMLSKLIDDARSRSALSELIYPLAVAGHLELRVGNLPLSHAHGEEAIRLAQDSRQLPLAALGMGLVAETEAALGLERQCREHASYATAVCDALDATAMGMWGRVGLGLLGLVTGDAEGALGPLEECERAAGDVHASDPRVVQWRANLVEARVRLGRTEEAERTLEPLERAAREIGGAWSRGAAARCRGLLCTEAEVDGFMSVSVEEFRSGQMSFDEGRSALAWGERLRRARRRSDSREHLRHALVLFERCGSKPMADRARRELEATGETVAGRAPELRDQLTPHELRIALRVAEGRTNPEVAAELFVSRKTVEHHLSQVYRKLGVRSRTELARVMAPALPEHPESARALSTS